MNFFKGVLMGHNLKFLYSAGVRPAGVLLQSAESVQCNRSDDDSSTSRGKEDKWRSKAATPQSGGGVKIN